MTEKLQFQEPFLETDWQKWRRIFPWLHLLRVPRIACQLQILVVGLVAAYQLMILDIFCLGTTDKDQLPRFGLLFGDLTQTMLSVLAPNVSVYLLGQVIEQTEQTAFPSHLMISLVIYVLSGLVICRMSASYFCRGRGVCVERSLILAVKKIPALLLSLSFPIIFMLFLWGVIQLLLITEKIPFLGSWLAGISYGLVLLISFLLVLFAAGFVAGWPLLIAALMTENSDGFSAWSRSFDYLRSRFIPGFICLLLSLTLGLFYLGIVGELTTFTLEAIDHWQTSLLKIPATEVADRGFATLDQGAVGMQNVWRTLWTSLLNGYLLTLYWSSVTAVYVLMRSSVDRIPLDEFRE